MDLVSSLLGWSSVQAHLNPLKPENFVYALRESLAQSASPLTRLVPASWALPPAMLGAALAQLYREVVDWLALPGRGACGAFDRRHGAVWGAPERC